MLTQSEGPDYFVLGGLLDYLTKNEPPNYFWPLGILHWVHEMVALG